MVKLKDIMKDKDEPVQEDDLLPMPFGKYKDTPMQDVPVGYLHYLWTNGLDRKSFVGKYITKSLHALKLENTDLIWD